MEAFVTLIGVLGAASVITIGCLLVWAYFNGDK